MQVELPRATKERVRGLCLALPEVTVRVDESRVGHRSTAYAFDVRRRPFCLLVATEGRSGQPVPMIVLRSRTEERAALLASGHPYFAPRSGRDRLGVALTPTTDWDEIRELITDSYRQLAPKKLIDLLD